MTLEQIELKVFCQQFVNAFKLMELQQQFAQIDLLLEALEKKK